MAEKSSFVITDVKVKACFISCKVETEHAGKHITAVRRQQTYTCQLVSLLCNVVSMCLKVFVLHELFFFFFAFCWLKVIEHTLC